MHSWPDTIIYTIRKEVGIRTHSCVSRRAIARQNVLVHCLAGAHRAGTAGVAALMLLCDWDRLCCLRARFRGPELVRIMRMHADVISLKTTDPII